MKYLLAVLITEIVQRARPLQVLSTPPQYRQEVVIQPGMTPGVEMCLAVNEAKIKMILAMHDTRVEFVL